METLRADAVHASASMHSTLSIIKDQDVNDLTKEKEEELLYGTGEDGDEEDALSDDSLRLRLSDDEAESDGATLQAFSGTQQVKSTTDKTEPISKQPEQSDDSQKQSSRSSMPPTKSAEDKQESGNVSVNEKVKNDQDTRDMSESDPVGSESSESNPAWRKIKVGRWRFSDSPRTRSFNHISRALPSRNCYSMYSESNRSETDNYKGRVKGGYTRGKRGRPRIYTYVLPEEKKDKKPKGRQGSSSASAGNVNSSRETHPVAIKNAAETSGSNNVKLDNVKESDRDGCKGGDKKSDASVGIEKQVRPSNESRNAKNVNNDADANLKDKQPVGDGLKSGKTARAANVDDKSTHNNNSDVCDVHEVDKVTKRKATAHDEVQSKIQKTKQSGVNVPEAEGSCKVEVALAEQSNSAKVNDSLSSEESLSREVQRENAKTRREDGKYIENKEVASTESSKMLKTETDTSNSDSNGNEATSIAEADDRDSAKMKIDDHEESDFRTRMSPSIIDSPDKRYNNDTDNEDTISFQKLEKKNFRNEEINEVIGHNILQTIMSDIVIKKIDVNENTKESSFELKGKDSKSNFVTSANDDKLSIRRLGSVGSDTTDNNVTPDAEGKTAEVVTIAQRRRRRTKKIMLAAQETATFSEDKQGKENGRQKRRTAKNAEEIIRKKFLSNDSDAESSDNSDKYVPVNHKMSHDARSISPPSLKRNYPDSESAPINGCLKKIKGHPEGLKDEHGSVKNRESFKNLDYVHRFFQRDLNDQLPKLKQEELEELLIQKIAETITMRGEIGKLREQARISERNQEATRARCQQLAKQIKDFEMVLKRNAEDQRANNGKPIAPIKINRSVGLQVNFTTEHGMQNLRQLQQTSNMKAMMANGVNSSTNEPGNTTPSPRRGIKVRSPRRSEPPVSQSTAMTQSQIQTPALVSTVTPAALVVAKPFEPQHTLTVPAAVNNTPQLLSNQQTQPTPQQQAIVINGKIPSQTARAGAAITASKGKPNDPIIDLTDEEEKNKSGVAVVSANADLNITTKPQACFQRVIQAMPGGNVAIASQQASIRLVQPASQPTPTALVNSMNASRVAYVMQSGVGSTRQLIITSSSNQIRPVTSGSRAPFSTVTYKTGISTIANGTVRVLTTPAGQNVQVSKHPAALPDTPVYGIHPVWKLPPPAPSLKISKVANGIVLSWNMALSDKYADIASYQLYAYQEVTGVPPNTALWKKVGDVRALPLPMACTLTQFSEGNNYYFAVRAVDTHSRKGQYSSPGNISL